MTRIRYLSAGLLVLTGMLHVAYLVMAKLDVGTIITVAFGVAYLAIAFFLFRSSKSAAWFGAIVPLVGLLLAALAMRTTPTVLGGVFIAIDILIVAGCFSLILGKKSELGRP